MEVGEPNEARRSTNAREAHGIQFRQGMWFFNFASVSVANLGVGHTSGHVVPHPVPVVRNTAKSLPLLHRHPTSLTPDEPFPA